jgi:exodeoxyribonuclease VII small subunit
MADTQQKLDFTQSVNWLEEINSWFQNEDFNLDEGLQKLREGNELIKKCRIRLKEVENEFVQIKQDFADGSQEEVVEVTVTKPQKFGVKQKMSGTHDFGESEEIDPKDVPF